MDRRVLKLALLKRASGREGTRAVNLRTSEARDSISGWIQQAAIAFSIELVVVEIPDQLRAETRAAEHRQIMVNLDDVAEDVGLSDLTLHRAGSAAVEHAGLRMTLGASR
jgi:hypothetical protein